MTRVVICVSKIGRRRSPLQIELHQERAIALPRLAKTRSPIVDELRSLPQFLAKTGDRTTKKNYH
ncbi:MAG TPA: hypothetical protein V6D30_22165 [Leptolyngbyaceae cyanobacterium]